LIQTWNPGDIVIHRYVGHHDWITWSRPHVVVSDTPECVALFQPESTVLERFDRKDRVPLESMTVRMNVLRLMYPNTNYAVLLFYDAGTGVPPWYQKIYDWPDGDFKGWKIELESPFKRTEIGFDTTDNDLDVIVRADLTWYWKDEESLARRVGHGVYSDDEAESFYADGRQALKAVEERRPPFSEPWPEWRPDERWQIPKTILGWQDHPGGDIDQNRKAPRVMIRVKPVS
jgi:hypothetical protein